MTTPPRRRANAPHAAATTPRDAARAAPTTTTTPFVAFDAPLVRGRFVRRYKRFFVDVVLDDGTPATAHTANTGTMAGLLVEGAPVLLTRHDGGRRALPLELEAICPAEAWVACNTIRANRVAAAFLQAGVVDGLDPSSGPLSREVDVGDGSRIDFALGDTLIEVKSVTLREGARALFPDAVSARGQRHLQVLCDHVAQKPGARAALLFLVQREDVDDVAAAAAIDPAYARLLGTAARAGVLLRAARVSVDVDAGGLGFAGLVPVRA
ncbi:MAG: DNA/RNA nuclease SfsA [Deltaproteobacteria bacterium]|nr:DNA/RNA nuclease SfsA [Deltaproteobacteria bacterium]